MEQNLKDKLITVINHNSSELSDNKVDKIKKLIEDKDEKLIASAYFHIGNGGINFAITDHYGPTLKISSGVFGNNIQSQEIHFTKDNFKTLKELFELAEKQEYSRDYCYATDKSKIETAKDKRQYEINRAYYLSTSKDKDDYTIEGKFNLEYLNPSEEELEVAKKEYQERQSYGTSSYGITSG